MGANNFDELSGHVGHKIECVKYAAGFEHEGDPANVAIECETCGVVLLSFDKEESQQVVTPDSPWDERQKAYIEIGGTKCPFCWSPDIAGDSVEVNEGIATQRMGCNLCDEEWIDTYALKSVEQG